MVILLHTYIIRSLWDWNSEVCYSVLNPFNSSHQRQLRIYNNDTLLPFCRSPELNLGGVEGQSNCLRYSSGNRSGYSPITQVGSASTSLKSFRAASNFLVQKSSKACSLLICGMFFSLSSLSFKCLHSSSAISYSLSFFSCSICLIKGMGTNLKGVFKLAIFTRFRVLRLIISTKLSCHFVTHFF